MPGLSGRIDGAAGKRDRYVLIEGFTRNDQGTSGLTTEKWEPLGYVWMSRQDLSGDERFGNDQESAYGDTLWVMPYQPNMDPEKHDIPHSRRLSYDCRMYDIVAATPSGWRRDIALVTLARTG